MAGAMVTTAMTHIKTARNPDRRRLRAVNMSSPSLSLGDVDHAPPDGGVVGHGLAAWGPSVRDPPGHEHPSPPSGCHPNHEACQEITPSRSAGYGAQDDLAFSF